MVLLNRFIASLFLLLPLILDANCATSESLQVPEHKIIHINSQYSAADVMRHELQTHENDFTLTSFETATGGLSARLVMLSPRYVARMSSSPFHVLEANQFDTFIRTAQIEKYTFENIGFKLCLPLSVLLIADETYRPDDNKTSASIIVMPRARGNSLFTHLVSIMSNDAKATMLFELGKSLASFQMAFMKKIEDQYYAASHGDFHGGNIFGILETNPDHSSIGWSFSLIDCAGLTLKGMHPLMDPLYFIYRANYVLFSNAAHPDTLYDLTKSFYRGYLSYLSSDVNKILYALLPDWRKIASTELTRTKDLLFFNEELPNARTYLSLFEPLNIRAAKSVFRVLGYEPEVPISFTGLYSPALTPYRLETGQHPPVPVVMMPVEYTCLECVPKAALTPRRFAVVQRSPIPSAVALSGKEDACADCQPKPALTPYGLGAVAQRFPTPRAAPAVAPLRKVESPCADCQPKPAMTPYNLGAVVQCSPTPRVAPSLFKKEERTVAGRPPKPPLTPDCLGAVQHFYSPRVAPSQARRVEKDYRQLTPRHVQEKEVKKVRRHSIGGVFTRLP